MILQAPAPIYIPVNSSGGLLAIWLSSWYKCLVPFFAHFPVGLSLCFFFLGGLLFAVIGMPLYLLAPYKMDGLQYFYFVGYLFCCAEAFLKS